MQRLTARFLLLFALVGSFLPLALAATTAPLHSCCIRKAHKCHEAASSDSEASFSAANCCTHDCCRGVTTCQWASPQPQATAVFANEANGSVATSHAHAPTTKLFASQSTRAPPAC